MATAREWIVTVDQIEESIGMGAGRRDASGALPARPRARRWRRWLLLAPLLFVLASVSQVLLLCFVDPPFSAMMLERQLGAWASGDWSYRIAYDWRDTAQIAPSLPISLVAAEDQRFPNHHGFDLDAIEKARDHNARGGRLRGASTISQQVAKNLFLWQGRSWLRKGLEAWYTVLIEALWSKQRILEVYANVAEFGDGVYGAQAAARSFWNKDAAQLTPAQSALLAAVLPAPQRYNAARPGPYVQGRANWIQRQTRQLGGPAYLQAP
ncbi:Biosynthetic peptidoglycan transglycosylase [Xanthomonas sacchari]|nr:Biosynthetic peptidoglycan transglycosylase [Xanthomonas sacchari]MCW0442113.1 Biosynthetic peptidoglycan transglycosylase [Xanthomonas sacchari]